MPRWISLEVAARLFKVTPHERGVMLAWGNYHLLIVGPAELTEDVGAAIMLAARPDGED